MAANRSVRNVSTGVSNSVTVGSLVGPYLLLKPLGEGGMSEVFLARHERLHRMTALKILRPEVSTRADLVERLLIEARNTARLRHPTIIEVFDCEVLPDGRPFIAMEYLEGETASAWLKRIERLANHPRLAAALVGEVARGLAVAHEHTIIHRDLKPANLFLAVGTPAPAPFAVKLLDFGIAKLLDRAPTITTEAGIVLGTPLYMSPEQCRNPRKVDHRTDIYSLGCVLFELLCGVPPFRREAAGEIMLAHVNEPAPDMAELEPSIPVPLCRLVARMLAKDPAQRPQAMGEVIESIEHFLACDRSRFASLLIAPGGLEVGSAQWRERNPSSRPIASTEASVTFRARTGSGRRMIIPAALAGVAAAAGLVFALLRQAPPAMPAVLRQHVESPRSASAPTEPTPRTAPGPSVESESTRTLEPAPVAEPRRRHSKKRAPARMKARAETRPETRPQAGVPARPEAPAAAEKATPTMKNFYLRVGD